MGWNRMIRKRIVPLALNGTGAHRCGKPLAQGAEYGHAGLYPQISAQSLSNAYLLLLLGLQATNVGRLVWGLQTSNR